MKNFNILKKRGLILSILFMCLGFYLCYHFFISPYTYKIPKNIADMENIGKKLITKDVLVNKIHQKQELIILEAELSEDIAIDDSWGNWSMFKKITHVNFAGKGTYFLDLSLLDSNNIEIKEKSKTIHVIVPEPSVKSIEIDNDKTTYSSTEKGLLRFGEIKLTPAENQMLIEKVKSKMMTKMTDPELHSQAISSTEKAVKELISIIIQNEVKNNYNIVIDFQKK